MKKYTLLNGTERIERPLELKKGKVQKKKILFIPRSPERTMRGGCNTE